MGAATGVTWMILVFFVPAIIVSLGLMAWQLIARRHEALMEGVHPRAVPRTRTSAGATMTSTKVVPWISRAILLLALVVLTLIGRKFIGNPVEAAATSGITLGSPLAVTNMRASFGAFPLGCALFILVCLLTSGLRRTGLVFVALIVGTALAVRIFGIVADGTLAESMRVTVAESVLLCLSLAAYAGERLASSSAIRRA